MTRNAFLFRFLAVICFAYSAPSFATGDSPVVQGLAGASRAGVAREGLFSNPASMVALDSAFGFFHFLMPRIPNLNAGGRGLNVGIYDGGDPVWKGAIGYSRTAKTALTRSGQRYIDRNEFKMGTARKVYGSISGGINVRWIKDYNYADTSRFFEGDVGVLFPLFGDLRGGLTYENVLNQEDETPATVGAGLSYALGYGFQLLADGYRLMSGTREGERGWSLAIEVPLAGDFRARAGKTEDAYTGIKGWSLGASWSGPRASFDYAFRTTGQKTVEKAHIAGITLSL